MTLVLSGERQAAAATSTNPFHLAVSWFAKVRAAREQRLALGNLLALDAHHLNDLGINRGDLFDAIHASGRSTRLLTERRSHRSAD